MLHQHGKHLQKDFAQKDFERIPRNTCSSFSKQNQISLVLLVLLSAESYSQKLEFEQLCWIAELIANNRRTSREWSSTDFCSVWLAAPTDKLVIPQVTFLFRVNLVLPFNGRKKKLANGVIQTSAQLIRQPLDVFGLNLRQVS